jgi:DNA primase large subunit
MEEALLPAEPGELDILNDTARFLLDAVYRLVNRVFGAKVLANMSGYARTQPETLVRSLAAELRRLARPDPVLTLDSLEEQCARSFPPCMHHIVASLTRSQLVSFKTRFQLSLFMKGLGLDYFAQYAFWKEKLWTLREQWHFESQVVLGLKQIYSLDEAEEDYSPHRCFMIINHDCPGNPQTVQGGPFG